MNLARILEQTQGDGVYRRISPSLVEESSRPVQVLEVVLIDLASPKLHVRNLEITPEVTC